MKRIVSLIFFLMLVITSYSQTAYDKLKAECTFLESRETRFEALCSNDFLKYFDKKKLNDSDLLSYKNSEAYERDLETFENAKKSKFAICIRFGFLPKETCSKFYSNRFSIKNEMYGIYATIDRNHFYKENYAIPVSSKCITKCNLNYQELTFFCNNIEKLRYIEKNYYRLDLVFVFTPSICRKFHENEYFVGSTLGIFLYNSVSGELVLDLSKYGRNIDSQEAKRREIASFNSVNTQTQAAKRNKEIAEKRKTAAREKAKRHHSTPKEMRCYICGGKGYVDYLENATKVRSRCTNCYGRGYTLEYYY